MIALLLLLLPGPAAAGSSKPYLPAPVPVSVKPLSLEGRLLGVGANRINVVTRWEDNFFSKQSEEIGETETIAINAALGLIRNRSGLYTEEWTLIAGKLDLKAKTRRYASSVIGKDVDVGASGSGFDLGLRYLGGYTLARSEFAGGRTADWNLALSLHAALYTLDNTYTADSVDGLDSNHYNATETGLFLRPAVAFQPIIEVVHGVSVVPYVGTNAMLILGVESYEDTRFVRNGVSGALTKDSEFSAAGRGFELVFGFDVGLVSPFSRGHKFMIGGALTKLYGGSSGDFSEVHLFYAFPIGRGSRPN